MRSFMAASFWWCRRSGREDGKLDTEEMHEWSAGLLEFISIMMRHLELFQSLWLFIFFCVWFGYPSVDRHKIFLRSA